MRTISEVDVSQCLWLPDFDLDESSSVFKIFKKLSYIQSVLYGCHAMSRIHCIPVVFVRRIICRNLKLIDHLGLVPSQKVRGGVSELHSDGLRYLVYRNTEKMWPAKFRAKLLKD
jgi:hypothetical protein